MGDAAQGFNKYYDLATKLGQIIQGESGAVNPVAFRRAQEILDSFEVTPKEPSE